AVSCLSQWLAAPMDAHWTAVKRIFRYLRGTRDYSLTYTNKIQPLIGYADASWNVESIEAKSFAGYITTVGNAMLTWQSRKQPMVALSTCEAEFMATVELSKEMIWLGSLLTELGFPEIVKK